MLMLMVFKNFVFVYLCILHLINGNVIFDILESHAFQQYSTCFIFTFTFTLESEEFEKYEKVAAAAAAAGDVIDHDQH